MRIIVVDDNMQFRESIEMYLNMRLGHDVIANFECAQSFLDSTEIFKADIILMDIEMPGLNGIEATKLALWKDKDLKVIAVTNYQDKAYLKNLISAGFKGCVFKNNVFDELNNAMDVVSNNKYYFPSNIQLDYL